MPEGHFPASAPSGAGTWPALRCAPQTYYQKLHGGRGAWEGHADRVGLQPGSLWAATLQNHCFRLEDAQAAPYEPHEGYFRPLGYLQCKWVEWVWAAKRCPPAPVKSSHDHCPKDIWLQPWGRPWTSTPQPSGPGFMTHRNYERYRGLLLFSASVFE